MRHLTAWLALAAACVVRAELFASEIPKIASDEDFEQYVMMSSLATAVLFISSHRDVADAEKLVERLGAEIPGLVLYRADVDDVKAVCSEFNVRKRMVPRLLVFNSRARQASFFKFKGDDDAPVALDTLLEKVKAELVENKKNAADEGLEGFKGKYEKLTLAIGSGKDEV